MNGQRVVIANCIADWTAGTPPPSRGSKNTDRNRYSIEGGANHLGCTLQLVADADGTVPLQYPKRLRRVSDNVDSLAGRDDFELHNKGQEIDHGAVALEPLGAAMRTPALLAGEGVA